MNVRRDSPLWLSAAKILWGFYAVLLVVLALGMMIPDPGTIAAAAVLLLAAGGVAARRTWAFPLAYAPLVLYAFDFAGKTFGLWWLCASRYLPTSQLRNRLHDNVLTWQLLDRPAFFFNWWGVPLTVTKLVLCLGLLVLLALAHRRLVQSGAVGKPMPPRVGRNWLTMIAAVSGLTLALAGISIVIAAIIDPPGKSSPGGFGPGMLVFYTGLYAIPWAILGAVGLTTSLILLKRNRRRTQGEVAPTPGALDLPPP